MESQGNTQTTMVGTNLAIPMLNELIGLSAASPVSEIVRAAEGFSQILFDRASCGDESARRQLLQLHVAYLNWAYARPHC